jgi:threonine synthase
MKFSGKQHIADPHTAAGFSAVRKMYGDKKPSKPTVVLGTADQAKFPETMAKVGGITIPKPGRYDHLLQGELQGFNHIPANVEAAARFILENAGSEYVDSLNVNKDKLPESLHQLV